MRVNLPVTQNAVLLAEDAMIASRTDLKGKITFVNQDFIDVSGFKEDELIGKNHHIIRHPDMPAAAYQSLWKTVKAGKPWVGIVKNRCKNGDHYWVEANVTPYKENGKVVGYLSIRRKATQQQIDEAETLYKTMQEGDQQRHLHKDQDRAALSLKDVIRLLLVTTLVFGLFSASFVYGLTSQLAGVWLGLAASLSVVSLLSVFFGFRYLMQHMVQPLDSLQTHLLEMAVSGQANSIQQNYALKELNGLRSAYNALEVRHAFKRIETENNIELIQSALDSATLPITIGGNENKLVYVNRAARKLWSSIGKGLPKEQANTLDVSNLIGAKLAPYIDPAHRKEFETSNQKVNILETQIGGRTIELTFNPVFNDHNRYLGRMIQWLDKTDERVAEKEVAQLVTHATAGHLSHRVDIAKLPLGFIHEIGAGINQMLDAVIGPVGLAANYIDQMAKGNIPSKITETFQGDFAALINNLNTCIDSINLLVSDTQRLSDAALAGELNTRADEKQHHGDFRTIVTGINGTLDAVIGPLSVAAHYVDEIAKGQIPQKITTEYNGDFNTIRNNLNTCIDAVNALVSDTAMLADAAAMGEVTVRADELKHAGDFKKVIEGINATLQKIVDPITTVKGAVETITTAASEIASGNSDLSSRTEQQVIRLEKTAQQMDHLSETVNANAANAKHANQLASVASKVAKQGGDVVGDVVATMNDINASAKKIEDIIAVIDGIAFQTNILALNAAVEAARAGDQGRGFAVVAGEVRALAQRSADAAKEIKELINDSVSKTAEGTKLVESAGSTMDEIVMSVHRVTEIVSNIAAASDAQAEGILQVNQAITDMDDTTQQNAALVEEAAAAAASLRTQADTLAKSVSVFKLKKAAKQHQLKTEIADNATRISHIA